jgi:hypothetical protein
MSQSKELERVRSTVGIYDTAMQVDRTGNSHSHSDRTPAACISSPSSFFLRSTVAFQSNLQADSYLNFCLNTRISEHLLSLTATIGLKNVIQAA